LFGDQPGESANLIPLVTDSTSALGFSPDRVESGPQSERRVEDVFLHKQLDDTGHGQQPTTIGHRLGMAVFNFFASLFFKIIETAPDWLVGNLLDRIAEKTGQETAEGVTLFQATCGDRGIDLAEQRLLVSSAFGAYFAGLLERDHAYINLTGQIEVQTRPGQPALDPMQSLYWALQYPKGPRLIIIAAEGGMGKSTLAAKLVRCLFEENAVDMILGDSAKTQRVDPVSGSVTQVEPGYYDPATFYKQLYAQLGLPIQAGQADSRVAVRNIRDRLEGRRAVIFVDNLETVAQGTALLQALRQLATRDARIIVTTRLVSGLTAPPSDILLTRLNPLTRFEDARDFLQWHIQAYASEHPDLTKLAPDVMDKWRVQRLLDRTGGIPLLMQLVFSDVARYSWQYLDQLPQLFGEALLDFLYRERWEELGHLGQAGLQARQLLRFVSVEQYRGKKITFERIRQWANQTEKVELPQTILSLLQERFLIVNHDLRQGSFAIFPSLAEFLNKQSW
jgi:hypothetical protein